MSTSKGQCCGDCVTTRTYSNDGKSLWKRNFGTDTIDVFTSGDDVFLIGNSSMNFRYLYEANIVNGSGNREKYVVPFSVMLQNNSNFGSYDFRGEFNERKKDSIFDSYKRYEYSGSVTNPNFSYPLEIGAPGNSKLARIFAFDSGLFAIKTDKIFGYYIDPSSTQYQLKNLGFVGTDFDTPHLSGNSIYLGWNKYCHAALSFPEYWNFVSGSPVYDKRELVDFHFNYDKHNLVSRTTVSGVNTDISVDNYSGTLMSFGFNYVDYNNMDSFGFVVKKLSGVAPEAYIQLYDTGCSPLLLIPSDVTYIYRGTGLIEHDDDSISYMSRYHYNSDYSGDELCVGSGNMFKAWKVLDYNVDDIAGRINVSLERVPNIYDSGSRFFRYDYSSAGGRTPLISGTGLINKYETYYQTTGLRTNINQFTVSNISSTTVLHNQNEILKQNFPEYDFNSISNYSGELLRYGQEVGTWKINSLELTGFNKEVGLTFSKLDYRTEFRDRSYDYVKKQGSGSHYNMTFHSFLNSIEVVNAPDTIDVNIVGSIGVYPCSYKNLCGNDAKYMLVSTTPVVGPITESTGVSYEISFLNEFTKNGEIDFSKTNYYISNTAYDINRSGWDVTTHTPIISVNNRGEFWVPSAFGSVGVPYNPICYSGVPPVESSGYHTSCGGWNHYMSPNLTIQVPALTYNLQAGFPGIYDGEGKTPWGVTKCTTVKSIHTAPTTYNVTLQSHRYMFTANIGSFTGCNLGMSVCYNSGMLISVDYPILDVEGWQQFVHFTHDVGTGVPHGCYPITVLSGNYYQNIPAIRLNSVSIPFSYYETYYGGQPYGVAYPNWSGYGPYFGGGGGYYWRYGADTTVWNGGNYGWYNYSTKYPTCLTNDCLGSGVYPWYYHFYHNFFNHAWNVCSGANIPSYIYLTVGQDYPISGQIDASNLGHWTCEPLDVSIPEGDYYGTGVFVKVAGFNSWPNVSPDTEYGFNNNVSGGILYSRNYENSIYGVTNNNSLNLLSKDANRYNYRY